MVQHTRSADRTDPLYEETISRFWVVRQHTTVYDDGVGLDVSPLPWGNRHVPVDAIDDASVSTYSASTYGGWHVGVHRTLGGNTVYRLRGSEGVELRLTDGTRIFVGSNAPDELQTAIERIVDSEVD